MGLLMVRSYLDRARGVWWAVYLMAYLKT
jgi:hypothetical protein